MLQKIKILKVLKINDSKQNKTVKIFLIKINIKTLDALLAEKPSKKTGSNVINAKIGHMKNV